MEKVLRSVVATSLWDFHMAFTPTGEMWMLNRGIYISDRSI